MPLVTPADVQTYLGQTIDTDRAWLLCDLADETIAEVFGGVLPSPVPVGFKAVALTIISRVYSNPNGYISEQIGSYSYNLNRNLTGNGIELTADERKRLRRAAGYSATRSVVLRPTIVAPPTIFGHERPL